MTGNLKRFELFMSLRGMNMGFLLQEILFNGSRTYFFVFERNEFGLPITRDII
jgi:hypothetical protein